jgi:Xaa-Pro aminopeptidase
MIRQMTSASEFSADIPQVTADEFASRRRRAAEAGNAEGFDCLLVWARGGTSDAFSDVLYFSNHYSPMVWVPPLAGVLTGCEHSAVLIGNDGYGTLLVSDFCAEDVQVDDVRRGWDLTGEVVASLADLGRGELCVGVIGEEVLPFGVVEAIRSALPRVSLHPADHISSDLRLRLSDAEVGMMRRAGRVGSAVYNTFLEHVMAGATEGAAVGAAWAAAAQIPGCMHWNFISASGPDADVLVRTSLPAWRPERVYQSGDVVHADCFGYSAGYCYDLARTVIVPGSDSRAKLRVAQATAEAVVEVASHLRSGVTSGELYEAGSSALASRGLSAALGSFGHGIGAGFFRPYLIPAGPDLERELEAPFGISIEIFATDSAGAFAYHEDNFLVLADETVCLTDAAGQR